MQKQKTSFPQRTLGPVSDLERHLPSEWWKSLFNSLYLKTDGDVVENQENTKRDVDTLIKTLGLKTQDRILDLCCGQGRHAIELAGRGFNKVTGVDRSRYLVRLARKRALNMNLPIQFSEGDARKFRLGDNSQDVVYLMGNSFGYFEREEDDCEVLESIKKTLVSEGRIALDITNGSWMRKSFEPRSWEWIDQDHFVCRERSLSSDEKRIISREVIVHAEKGVIADQFYAERLYDESQIKELLEKLSFDNIEVHNSIETSSTRNHDLGMMANRLFVTAVSPVKKSRPKTKKSEREVLVLLGDPRLADSVKKGGTFNSEDLETVDRLKNTLNDIEGYKFQFLDNHATFLRNLPNKTNSFVLNFCDEGYLNDAFKELHVPALLEMLNIPYSGAGPASLGLCYNKSIIRSMAISLDIPVPEETYYDPSDQAASIPSIFPAILKPNYGDSSIGITKDAVVSNAEQLIAYLENLREILPNTPILIQEFLAGNEYSVGIIGNQGNYTVLPILEVDYSKLPKKLPKILGYESKWLPDSPYWNDISYIESNLDEENKRKLIDASISLFERTGCRDYARFDFRAAKDGKIKLLEVNPNPGWCWDGKLNLMAGFGDYSYKDLLQLILKSSTERYESYCEQSDMQSGTIAA
ncbi:MAG: methyltransferase domain-containing protein [Rickettsiales bacterium]|nr:methyltransferase domain-containing protein [Pseudomonadota bacterium]MDA0967596.1 methyltransferase domain-containing protein [Pseudomonadota bacterium]MDG4544375.1 methyltransferase domain-containing protein [Rickettsiales bacterium]MDG4546505.1 methyltransferase domain-containing protein [Rickettsiales bacterium]MDG4548659.1 methyltransferase domain-containing protein [Rickettsiales bacterium]